MAAYGMQLPAAAAANGQLQAAAASGAVRGRSPHQHPRHPVYTRPVSSPRKSPRHRQMAQQQLGNGGATSFTAATASEAPQAPLSPSSVHQNL